MAKDLWEGESDTYTDYEGTITEASFQSSENGVQIKFVFDEIDGKQEPQFEYYAIPPGWESNDGGETIERVDGQEKGFSKRSQWWKFLNHVAGLEGAKAAVGEDAAASANAWIGTRWRMEITEDGKGKPYKFTDKKTGEEVSGVSRDKNYPVAFLGKDAGAPTSGSTNGAGKVDSLSVLTTLNNPLIESQIQELAKTTDFKSWFSQSFALVQGVGVTAATHPDLITAMGGRDLYEKLGGKG